MVTMDMRNISRARTVILMGITFVTDERQSWRVLKHERQSLYVWGRQCTRDFWERIMANVQ